METSKANRIFWALVELVSIADGMDKEMNEHHDGSFHTIGPYWNRLKNLHNRPEYKELKDWLRGK